MNDDPHNPDPQVDPPDDPTLGSKSGLRIERMIVRMYKPNYVFSSGDVNFRTKTISKGRGKDKVEEEIIDVMDDDNRMVALYVVGVSDLTFDYADNSYRYRYVYRYSRHPTADDPKAQPYATLAISTSQPGRGLSLTPCGRCNRLRRPA